MPSLAVFDFDRTVVDDDSDATIINRLREKQPPPEWEAGNHDWTPYMNDVFGHAHSAGFSPEDILESIASMRATPGMEELFQQLAARGWDIVLLTDANSVFVRHWLKTHSLERYVTTVITNRAFWLSGRLYIEPCMRQSACPHCPSNLCKSLALAQWCDERDYDRIVYTGDGRNDYCPVSKLPASAVAFPRAGYPLSALVTAHRPACSAVHWDDAYTITRHLFPDDVIDTD